MESCETCKYQNKAEHEEPCKNCSHNATDNYEPLTNADRIRSMTDEELANILFGSCMDIMGDAMDGECVQTVQEGVSCRECVLRWLQSEVE